MQGFDKNKITQRGFFKCKITPRLRKADKQASKGEAETSRVLKGAKKKKRKKENIPQHNNLNLLSSSQK